MVPYEEYESVKETGEFKLISLEIRLLLLDLKKGNPFRGASFTIKYGFTRLWKTKIRTAGTPIAKEGSTGLEKFGTITGRNSKIFTLKKAQIKEKMIQYRALRISLGSKIAPFSSWIFSLNLGESAESWAKGLLKPPTNQVTKDNIRKEEKAQKRLKRPIPQDTINGVSHKIKISSLFLVQYGAVKSVIGLIFPVSCYKNDPISFSGTPQGFSVFSLRRSLS